MKYCTKLTLEIEVETQFGPADAISVVDNITRFPAIKSLTLLKAESDYKAPFETDLNFVTMQNIPRKIR
jgi:hypothetical protein